MAVADTSARVAICMGSDSDLPVMREAAAVLTEFGVAHEVRILSAHRTPVEMTRFAEQAAARGLEIIIAGAGGAAHLPGMMAASTLLPVIGVPVPSKHLQGLDSLLSIVQMPGGVPVACVAIGNAKNAGLLAIRMLAVRDEALREKLEDFALSQHQRVVVADQKTMVAAERGEL